MSDINTVVGAAVLCAFLAFVLRESKSSAAIPVALLGSLLLTGVALSRLEPLVQIKTLLDQTGLEEVALSVGKVLGVGYVAEVGADACRELGAASVAGKLEFCGRVEILLLCLPTLRTLIEQAMGMLG